MLAISDQRLNLILTRPDISHGVVRIREAAGVYTVEHTTDGKVWFTILEHPTKNVDGDIVLGIWLQPIKDQPEKYLAFDTDY